VDAAVCDCTLITWNDPQNIPDEFSGLVGYTSDITVREAGPNQDSLYASAGARACDPHAISCDYEYSVVARMSGGDPLPDWMEYNQPVLTVNPSMAEHIGVWTVEIEQVRTSNAVTTVYDAARVTIDCIIETFEYPNTPLDENTVYTVFDDMLSITLDPPFTQNPPCGYAVDETFSWTIPVSSPIAQTDDPYTVRVLSSRTTDETVSDNSGYRVYLEDYITYTHPTAGAQVWTETIFYDITVINPCVDTIIDTSLTSFSDILYYVEDAKTRYRFEPVTDSISNTVSGATCGAF
jgi:hypothetical protein